MITPKLSRDEEFELMRESLRKVCIAASPVGTPKDDISIERLCDLAITLTSDCYVIKEVLYAERKDLQFRADMNPSGKVSFEANKKARARVAPLKAKK